MVETSTPVSDSQIKGPVQRECISEDLNEEDQVFLESIREDLNKLKRTPQSSTLDAVMKYSRSL